MDWQHRQPEPSCNAEPGETAMKKGLHGGRRAGSGRKPLVDTTECMWIVGAVRKALKDTENTRMERWTAKHLPKEVGASRELKDHQSKLNKIPIKRRPSVTKNPVGTSLEDIQIIFSEGQVSRGGLKPKPNHFELSAAYAQVAGQATQHFKKRITKRQVQRCVQEWLKLEATLKADIG